MAASFALFLTLGSVLGLTVWRLWFRRDPELDPRVYTIGVQGFGLTTWAFSILLLYFQLGRYGLAIVICLLPLYLWAGYWWGRCMMLYFARREGSTRPSNNRWRGP